MITVPCVCPCTLRWITFDPETRIPQQSVMRAMRKDDGATARYQKRERPAGLRARTTKSEARRRNSRLRRRDATSLVCTRFALRRATRSITRFLVRRGKEREGGVRRRKRRGNFRVDARVGALARRAHALPWTAAIYEHRVF